MLALLQTNKPREALRVLAMSAPQSPLPPALDLVSEDPELLSHTADALVCLDEASFSLSSQAHSGRDSSIEGLIRRAKEGIERASKGGRGIEGDAAHGSMDETPPDAGLTSRQLQSSVMNNHALLLTSHGKHVQASEILHRLVMQQIKHQRQ